MESLNKRLIEYNKLSPLRFHTPAHKGKINLSGGFDITELDFSDNLANPRNVLKALNNAYNTILKTDRASILVNGSTSGIFAAVYSTEGGFIIESTAHKSVFNSLKLKGVTPVVIEIEMSNGYPAALTAQDIEGAYADAHIKPAAVIVTSPNYYGICADIESIKKTADKLKLKLIIDAAHGAHFNAYRGFKKSGSNLADLYITSLHKTMPSLTMTAVMGGKTEYMISAEKILNTLNTSSPSYLLLSSMESCLNYFGNCDEKFEKILRHAEQLKREFACLKNDDPFRIVLCADAFKMTGKALEKELQKQGIYAEFSTNKYVILILSVADEVEEIQMLIEKLKQIKPGNSDIETETADEKDKIFPDIYYQ